MKREHGFALLSVLGFALLYFALMELVLIESTWALRSAGSFRSRVIANTLAEDGIELVARGMTSSSSTQRELQTEHGRMTGAYRRLTPSRFRIEGSGESREGTGVPRKVVLSGHINGETIVIERARYD